MSMSILVFGAGSFGSAIALDLFKQGQEVVLVDKNYDLVQYYASSVTATVQCDIQDELAMEELGISNYDVCVVSVGEDLGSSIIAVMTAKDKGVKRVIAKVSSQTQGKILKKLGADQLVYPEQDMAIRVSRSITGSSVFEYIHLSDEYSLFEIQAKANWVGKTLKELDLRDRYGLTVIAFRRYGNIIVSPHSGEIIKKEDSIVVIGLEDDFDKLK